MSAKREEIRAAWAMFEDAEPDISTERLLQQVADHCLCDVDDVVRAITPEKKMKGTRL